MRVTKNDWTFNLRELTGLVNFTHGFDPGDESIGVEPWEQIVNTALVISEFQGLLETPQPWDETQHQLAKDNAQYRTVGLLAFCEYGYLAKPNEWDDSWPLLEVNTKQIGLEVGDAVDITVTRSVTTKSGLYVDVAEIREAGTTGVTQPMVNLQSAILKAIDDNSQQLSTQQIVRCLINCAKAEADTLEEK